MESLVVHAATRTSAEGFCSALSGFRATLIEAEDGRYQVEIPMGRSNREIIEALNALESYVSSRGDGPARVDVDGRGYTLHPTGAVRQPAA